MELTQRHKFMYVWTPDFNEEAIKKNKARHILHVSS